MLKKYRMDNPKTFSDEVGLRVVKIIAVAFLFSLYLII